MLMANRSMIVSASYDQNIRIWDPVSEKTIITMPHAEAQVNSMAFQPGTNHLAVASWQKVRLFDLMNAQPSIVGSYEGAPRNFTCVGFENHGRWMYTGGEDACCRVYDTRTVHFSIQRTLQVSSPITSVVLNLVILFIADQNGIVTLWDLSSGMEAHLPMPLMKTMEFVVKLAVHPQGHMLSGITNRGYLITWAIKTDDQLANGEPGTTCTLINYVQINNEHGLSLRYTPGGEHLVITFSDNKIFVVNSENDKQRRCMDAQCEWNWDALFTCDGRKMFTGGNDNKVKIWDLERGIIISKLEGHAKPLTALCLLEK